MVKSYCLSIFLILTWTAFVFFSVPLDADFGWWEAGRHAMDGLFYRDFFLEGGILRPLEYTFAYYQRYPAITPVMYPPFFGVAEIIGFSLIGPYPWVARLTVAFFLALGGFGLMKLTEDWLGEDGSLYAGLSYMSLPLVIYWSRDVMLETPAMALVIWSFLFFQRYLKENKTRDIALCVAFGTLCPYTKQNTAFVFPVLLCAALMAMKLDRITDRRFLVAIAISGICGIPLVFVTLKWGMVNIHGAFGSLTGPFNPFSHIYYYIRTLPESLGSALLIMAVVGLAVLWLKRATFWKRNRTDLAILFTWCILCYLQMVVVKIKEPRHGFFWMPVFAILAALGLKTCLSLILGEKWRTSFGYIITFGVFAVNLANCQMNWSKGYGTPALYLKNHWEGSAVLCSISRDAPFIFHVRSVDPDKRFRVYRSEKIFESMAIYKSWGVKSFIQTRDQLLSALRKYGIRFMLLQQPMPEMTPVEKLLVQVAGTDQFQKIKEFPITYPNYGQAVLSLYRYNGAIDSPGAVPPVHLPVVGKTIPGQGLE